jgi:hypothetical protein
MRDYRIFCVLKRSGAKIGADFVSRGTQSLTGALLFHVKQWGRLSPLQAIKKPDGKHPSDFVPRETI